MRPTLNKIKSTLPKEKGEIFCNLATLLGKRLKIREKGGCGEVAGVRNRRG
jgi:hypothetical protein